MRAAQDAVRRCQPYAVLPPAKYQEWRLLDLPVLAGGHFRRLTGRLYQRRRKPPVGSARRFS